MCEKLSVLKDAKNIWIYGAGKVANQVIKIFSNAALEFPIKGVVVSKKGEQKECAGYSVNELEEVNISYKETLFVIAVSPKFQEEILAALKRKGYSQYIIWKKEYAKEIWRFADYRFDNRKQNAERACFILSGYKEFLWRDVFDRLNHFQPVDLDVCIISSGVLSEELAAIAEKHGWSYLCTKINDIALIQNIAFLLFDNAQWIYKMDEDIFLTDGCFDKLFQQYLEIEKKDSYHIGFLAPLINVNGYGYIKILKQLNKLEEYERLFERAFYGADSCSMIEKDSGAAQYMWGYRSMIPQLDVLNRTLENCNEYSICGLRFSIGFILMNRELWENMGGYTVSGRLNMGIDERELCQYCNLQSLAVIVSENTVVGHFSFGKQFLEMKKFYENNHELFQIN